MKHRKKALIPLAATASLAILLTGCTTEEEPVEESTSEAVAEAPNVPQQQPTPSASTPQSDEGGDPGVSEVNDGSLQEVAVKYISERENQASHHHEKPNDWLKEVEKHMTKEGFKELSDSVGAGDGAGGYAWNVSHEQGLAVKADTGECEVIDQAGVDTDTEKVVGCAVTDVVVDKDGEPVPVSDIPPTWPFVGPQDDALLHMKKEGESWKVHMDMTGMAN